MARLRELDEGEAPWQGPSWWALAWPTGALIGWRRADPKRVGPTLSQEARGFERGGDGEGEGCRGGGG